MAEKEKENENSAGWLPEMSFQTVLSLVGVVFTAFELYQRFRPKSSSGSPQSPISPREEPKQSGGDRDAVGLSQNPAEAKPEQSSEQHPERSKDQSSERRLAKPRETPSVQNRNGVS